MENAEWSNMYCSVFGEQTKSFTLTIVCLLYENMNSSFISHHFSTFYTHSMHSACAISVWFYVKVFNTY